MFGIIKKNMRIKSEGGLLAIVSYCKDQREKNPIIKLVSFIFMNESEMQRVRRVKE